MNANPTTQIQSLLPVGRCTVIGLTCLGLLLSGCTTVQSVAMPTQPDQPFAVHQGDHVQLQTKDGYVHSFTVTQIEQDALAGKDIRVKFQDIEVLQVKRMNLVKAGANAVEVTLIVGGALALTAMGLPPIPL